MMGFNRRVWEGKETVLNTKRLKSGGLKGRLRLGARISAGCFVTPALILQPIKISFGDIGVGSPSFWYTAFEESIADSHDF